MDEQTANPKLVNNVKDVAQLAVFSYVLIKASQGLVRLGTDYVAVRKSKKQTKIEK